jgi:transcriptional regulator with XRE-family HTH domain
MPDPVVPTSTSATGSPEAPQGFTKRPGRPRREDWKALRERDGLSLSELEERTGINRGTLSRIERSHEPLPHQARALLAVFDHPSDIDGTAVRGNSGRSQREIAAVPSAPKGRLMETAPGVGDEEAGGLWHGRPRSSVVMPGLAEEARASVALDGETQSADWAPGELQEAFGR